MIQLVHNFKSFKVMNSGPESNCFVNICSKSKNCHNCLKWQKGNMGSYNTI